MVWSVDGDRVGMRGLCMFTNCILKFGIKGLEFRVKDLGLVFARVLLVETLFRAVLGRDIFLCRFFKGLGVGRSGLGLRV
jgi:hypothetical protein